MIDWEIIGGYIFLILFVLVCLFGSGGLYWFCVYQEARTYERLTGKHVTTWDALWVDLRVMEGVK